MTIDWQLVYQESQNLAMAMKNDLPWQVLQEMEFGDWIGIVMGTIFLLLPFLLGIKWVIKEMGCFFIFFEGFVVVWLSFWIFASVISKFEFSSTPYLVTLQDCSKRYDTDDKKFYIIGITQKQDEITPEGLINLEEYQYTDKDDYWVSEEVFEYAQKNTSNQLIIINDNPVGIVNVDGSFLLDY